MRIPSVLLSAAMALTPTVFYQAADPDGTRS